MKRRIISALAGIFAIAVFAGCQQPAQSSDSGSGTKNSDTEVKETNGFEGDTYSLTADDKSVVTVSFTSDATGKITIKKSKTSSYNFDYSVSTQEKTVVFVSAEYDNGDIKKLNMQKIGNSLLINRATTLFDSDSIYYGIYDIALNDGTLTLKKL